MQASHVIAYALLLAILGFLALALWRATREQRGMARARRRFRRARKEQARKAGPDLSSPHPVDLERSS